MPSPPPEELLRRLRAVYCRHKSMTYEQYDVLVAEERISFAELKELVEVLFTELQHAGLYDFIFREEAQAKQRDKDRLAEIEAQLKRIGSVGILGDLYKDEIARLTAEGNEIRQRLT